ncbi:MAG TPA: hypothetical protein VFE88_01570 [Candidatus Nanoarchaeia archaeon]|nr:hypothetical protein [Candidatus Nanoarchaeia archaeon]
MYTILKPEARRYHQKIDRNFIEEGFKISSRYALNDWDQLANKLYAPQISGDPTFASEFHSCLWLTQQLFGNNGAILLLEREGDLKRNLEDLCKIKRRFREQLFYEIKDALRFLLDIDAVDPEGKLNIGTRGKIYIADQLAISNDREGRWDSFFFKYIHTPDPDVESYRKEIALLEREGVLHHPLSEQEWEIMSSLETLIPPGLKKGRNN